MNQEKAFLPKGGHGDRSRVPFLLREEQAGQGTCPRVPPKTASAAEEKAMAEYRQTIAYIKDFELRDLFWEHLIDEELHSLWLAKKAEELN